MNSSSNQSYIIPMQKQIVVILLWSCIFYANAQDSTRQVRTWPLNVSLFNNQTSLPVGMKLGMAESPVHPGFTIGTAYLWKSAPRHILQQPVTLGYYYHQYAQHGIQLYTELQYRYTRFRWLQPEAGAGLGYLHAISDLEQFELNAQGNYEKKRNWGKPRLMVSTHVGLFVPLKQSKGNSACTMCRNTTSPKTSSGIFVRYQFWLQAPFVKNYVPLLPNTALHVGYSTTLTCKNKKGGRQ